MAIADEYLVRITEEAMRRAVKIFPRLVGRYWVCDRHNMPASVQWVWGEKPNSGWRRPTVVDLAYRLSAWGDVLEEDEWRRYNRWRGKVGYEGIELWDTADAERCFEYKKRLSEQGYRE